MELSDLLGDVLQRLPENRRHLVAKVANEYQLGDDMSFLLALVAASNLNERRLVRQFIKDLEEVDRAQSTGDK